ncbi:hypothetical protein BC826DRAFT_1053680 [Russula brevipes]|nr:hypothetical protein BC826DRAFT_1053680 [Russula brevipes]
MACDVQCLSFIFYLHMDSDKNWTIRRYPLANAPWDGVWPSVSCAIESAPCSRSILDSTSLCRTK